EHPELQQLLDNALGSLLTAIKVRAAAIWITREDAIEFDLGIAAARGLAANRFGDPPSFDDLSRGQPIVDAGRAIVPILFRGQPRGPVVRVDPHTPPHAIEFCPRAVEPLAIAVSNARAYAALQHLARALTERNQALVRQRDQLQEMNRLKSEFLANVSHELRT